MRLESHRRGGTRFGAQTALGPGRRGPARKHPSGRPPHQGRCGHQLARAVDQVPLDLAFGRIKLPCLHVTGTADNSIVGTTTALQRRLPFDYSKAADRYLVTLFVRLTTRRTRVIAGRQMPSTTPCSTA